MRITRLYLRNYRVYEQELDLEVPAGLVGIYGMNGSGKCLPADTRVWDGETGEALTIERFVVEQRKSVLGFSEGQVQPVRVSDWHDLGDKPIVRVTLESGARIDVATTHPLLTDRGCIRAEDLRSGDWVGEARSLPEVAAPLLSDDEALLLGLLLGDGCMTGHTMRLSAAEPSVVDVFRGAVERSFPGCTVKSSIRGYSHCVVSALNADERQTRRAHLARRLQDAAISLEALVGSSNVGRFLRGGASPSWETVTECEEDFGLDLWDDKCALYGGRALTEWAKDLGIHGCNAFTKRVPERFLLMPESAVKHLLAGLMLTDGYVSDPRKTGGVEVSYTSRSEQLAKDVRTLFLRLGMTSTLRARLIHGKPSYTVFLTAAAHERLGELPLVGPKAERVRMVAASRKGALARPVHDLIPPSFCASLPTRSVSGRQRSRLQLGRHAMSRDTYLDFGGDPDVANAEIAWSRVASIETLDRSERCFDLTVDTPEHLYLADTFIVHNSSLIEVIRWTLYGQARTAKDEIRTAGVNGDCVTEVEFEHEGHLYLVRRTITGVNHTVKAEAHWNNQQVAEGVRDVATYVHSVLGMDDTSFRASVFAEQKQIAAFSAHGPQKRRDLVLRLLGITPLDKARDAARADAREARSDHERLANRLPDLDALEAALTDATTTAQTVGDQLAAAEAALVVASAASDAAEAALEQLDDVARTYDSLVLEGKAAANAITEATDRLAALREEAATLADAETQLAELRPRAEGIDALEALAAAQATVEALPALEQPVEPNPTIAAGAKDVAERASATAAELAGALKGAEQELARAEASASRSAELSPDEDCPVCGQALGDAFEQVVAHRAAEVEAARTRIAELREQHATAMKASKEATKAADVAAADLTAAQQAWSTWQHHAARRTEAEAALASARTHPFCVALATSDVANATRNEWATRKELAARRMAATEVAKLEARLERAPKLATEIDTTAARVEQATAEREQLLEKVKALGYGREAHEQAKAARQQARATFKQASDDASAARQRAATAQATVTAAQTRLDDGKAQHADLADLAERSRHLGRLGDLLSDFRNNVVATVGPRLAAQAAELFAELTDHEYDQLEVDPETYEIQIRDAGRTYGMDRFSGSEIDLANLALRVAISEHVRFQSGGAVGLLVLDEVFGPLDDERKERMLLALERLKGRFRQVLVVTHDTAIKEQLPNAIQVEKLPGRRARAHLVAGS